jgi:lipooligosaccharide transport system ATP-binding protein
VEGAREPLIEIRGLRKSYGDFVAVDDIDVEVAAGESFGFLGPNGAGKTSTMKIIGCTSPATGGTVRVLGMDPATDASRIKARLGVIPQEDALDNDLTVVENLLVYGRYFGMSRSTIASRAEELLEFAQLLEKRDEVVERLSGGMRRRLTIARGLINTPQIVLLDEPTTGLDPQARHVLWDRLFRLKREGVTLVLTTHYMDEAEQLCDRLVVMDKGRIVAQGSPRALIREHASREVLELRFDVSDHADHASDVDGLGGRVEVLADRLLLYVDDGDAALEALTARGVHPMSSLVRRASLEDVFLRLTGRSLIE